MESIGPPPYYTHDRFGNITGSMGSGALGSSRSSKAGRKILNAKTLAQMITQKERIGTHCSWLIDVYVIINQDYYIAIGQLRYNYIIIIIILLLFLFLLLLINLFIIFTTTTICKLLFWPFLIKY